MATQWNDYTRVMGTFVPPNVVTEEELEEKNYAQAMSQEEMDELFPEPLSKVRVVIEN